MNKPLAYVGLVVAGYMLVSMSVGLCKQASHFWQNFSYEQPRSQLHSSKLATSTSTNLESTVEAKN
jgi:hypothetical protein